MFDQVATAPCTDPIQVRVLLLRQVELAKRRLGGAADIRQANLAKPLTFLSNESFDVVLSSLTLHYIRNWRITFGEFYRVLRRDGCFVLSVGHPFFDYTYFKSEKYFETELVGSEWKGFDEVKVYMPTFRRSLEETLNPLIEAGFRIERILEPRPTEDFREADPEDYEELLQWPSFLCIRARK